MTTNTNRPADAGARSPDIALAGPLARFQGRLSLPLIAAPMFLVSGTALVSAACRGGRDRFVPDRDCRSVEQLGQWLRDIRARARRLRAGPRDDEPRRSRRT